MVCPSWTPCCRPQLAACGYTAGSMWQSAPSLPGWTIRRSKPSRVVPVDDCGYRVWAGASSTDFSEFQERQLHTGSTTGDAALVTSLLAQNCDPNAKDSKGFTPLHRAAYTTVVSDAAKSNIVRLLLGAGADPNAKSADSWVPTRIRPRIGHAGRGAVGPQDWEVRRVPPAPPAAEPHLLPLPLLWRLCRTQLQ